MALSSSAIGEKAGLILNDLEEGYEHERTPIAELITWMFEGCLEMVRLKPTVLTERVSMKLVPGSTRQKVSGDGLVKMADGEEITGMVPLQLLEVGRNMGADGKTPGSAVRVIDPLVMDGMLPDWHTQPAEKEIRWVMIDANERLAFQVCFKAPAEDHYLEGLFSRKPVHGLSADATELGTADLDAGLSIELESGLVAYVVYRALIKDGMSQVNEGRAQNQLQRFGEAIGVEFQKDRTYPVRKRRTPQDGDVQ